MGHGPAKRPSPHRVLKKQAYKCRKKVNESKFNMLEDSGREVGIIGSGIGFYHAKSLLETQKCFLAKTGTCVTFPRELVKRFASKLKKIIVIEELRPYMEDNLRGLNVEVLGKNSTWVEEIGEFTPDGLREAFAKLGCVEGAERQTDLNLPPRPPVLCPGCPHRAFYYALNNINQFISCDTEKCVGCDVCEYACSGEKRTFQPNKIPNSRIKT